MENDRRILLTGASGTVGYEVLKQLCQNEKHFDITVFDKKSRRSVKLLSPFKNRVEIVFGDIANEQEVEKVCHEKDVVIHLAAIIPPLADETPEMAEGVNTIGTANLIRGLEQFSHRAFFIYSSSISVYGDRLKNPCYQKKHSTSGVANTAGQLIKNF